MAVLLSAVQLLPSAELAARSTRADVTLADRFLAHTPADTHLEDVYQFSVGPWRWAEYLWPNVAGRQFPVNHRWLDAVPAEGRVWTPSLYLGLVPLLLALAGLRFRRGEAVDRWASWSAALALVAGLGWYGFGWLAHEAGVDPPVGEPFGGLYWLMTLVLPGYAQFRYPAKLLVIVALGLGVLAAREFDRQQAAPTRGFRLVLAAAGGLSLLAMAVWACVRGSWTAWLASVPPDGLFGPLDIAGASADVLWALSQTAVLAAVLLLVFLLPPRWHAWQAPLVVALLAVDLAVAQRWMIVGTPAAAWERASPLAAQARVAQDDSAAAPPRVARAEIDLRHVWQAEASVDRLSQKTAADRFLLRPRMNLAEHVGVIGVEDTVVLADFHALMRAGGKTSLAAQVVRIDIPSLDAHATAVPGAPTAAAWLAPSAHPLPRAWLAMSVVRASGEKRTGQVLPKTLTAAAIDRLIRSPVIECDDAAWSEIAAGLHSRRPADESHRPLPPPRIVSFEPSRVVVEVETLTPALLVVAEQHFPGWSAEVQTDAGPPRLVPILRTNGAMRGVWLPAGRHAVAFCYRPASFRLGAAISLVAVLACAALAWRARRLAACYP